MIEPLLKNNKLKDSELIECRYTIGGGMLGGFSSATIKKLKDGSIKYISEHAQTHADRIVTKTYDGTIQDLDRIKELIIKYNMYGASKKGLSPFQVLDGDTRTINFYFDNERFSVSDNQNLSTEESKHFREIINELLGLAKGEAVVEIENHVLVLMLDGYQIAYTLFDCTATEQLIEYLDEYDFNDYEGVYKYATIEHEFDFTNLEKVNDISVGDLCFNDDTKQLLFCYKDFNTSDNVYKLGELEDYTDSAIDLINKMEDKKYVIFLRK